MLGNPPWERVKLQEKEWFATRRPEIAEARKTMQSVHDDRGANFMKLVRAHRTLDIVEREGRPFEVEVQVICLGTDLAWVALPGEVFVELGLAKEALKYVGFLLRGHI